MSEQGEYGYWPQSYEESLRQMESGTLSLLRIIETRLDLGRIAAFKTEKFLKDLEKDLGHWRKVCRSLEERMKTLEEVKHPKTPPGCPNTPAGQGTGDESCLAEKTDTFLRSCPFCHHPDLTSLKLNTDFDHFVVIQCLACGAQGPHCKRSSNFPGAVLDSDSQRAASAWNRRK